MLNYFLRFFFGVYWILRGGGWFLSEDTFDLAEEVLGFLLDVNEVFLTVQEEFLHCTLILILRIASVVVARSSPVSKEFLLIISDEYPVLNVVLNDGRCLL